MCDRSYDTFPESPGFPEAQFGIPWYSCSFGFIYWPFKKKKRQSFMHNPVSLSRQETDMFILWQLRYLCFAQCLGAGVPKIDKSVCKFDFCWWWSFSWLTWQIFSNGFQIKRTGTTVLKSSSTDVDNMCHVGTLSKYGGWGGNLSTLRKNTDSLQHIPSG